MQRKFCKPPADAALAAKGASKARKAKKRSGMSGPDFRAFESPNGFQVKPSVLLKLVVPEDSKDIKEAAGFSLQVRAKMEDFGSQQSAISSISLPEICTVTSSGSSLCIGPILLICRSRYAYLIYRRCLWAATMCKMMS